MTKNILHKICTVENGWYIYYTKILTQNVIKIIKYDLRKNNDY